MATSFTAFLYALLTWQLVQGRHADVQSITFNATSNAVKAGLIEATYRPTVHRIWKDNTVLRRAFNKPELDHFQRYCRDTGKPCKGVAPEEDDIVIIQHSGGAGDDTITLPARKGLVSTILNSYNGHHELELRPDDFWQAILTQFSIYVNNRAEALRDRFVDFQGQKTLVIESGGTLFTADFARLASRMVDEQIVKNIKDPDLAEWLIPDFSTTEENDRIVSAVTMMSTLQAYFEFEMRLLCGIPKVTLLGTVEDWQKLRTKIDRLLEFDLWDKLVTQWHELLAPVLDELVRSSEGHPNLDFWDRVASIRSAGSGDHFLSGWLTVFAVFSDRGVWHGERRERDFRSLPEGAVGVPVVVDDNGVKHATYMFAGQVAEEVLDSGVGLRPRSDWCIAYIDKKTRAKDDL